MESNTRPESMERIVTNELADAFVAEQVARIQEQVGDKKVLLALSGGVDSSVVAALLIKAIGKQLVCVHVNHGLLRKGEPEQVVEVFRGQMDANVALCHVGRERRNRICVRCGKDIPAVEITDKGYVDVTGAFEIFGDGDVLGRCGGVGREPAVRINAVAFNGNQPRARIRRRDIDGDVVTGGKCGFVQFYLQLGRGIGF